jgi:GxxExxY protein
MHENLLHSDITNGILKAFFKVYNTMGYGFLEKVYENCMAIELRRGGFMVVRQERINVFYEGETVGEYFTDLLVDGKVIIELKAAEGLREEHENQLMNYLKATEVEVGLLLNFGEKPVFKRKVFTNIRKKMLPSRPQ